MKKYSLGLYEKAMPGTLDWKEKLEAAKEAGYDFVEISIDATEEKIARLDMTKEDRFEIIKAMYEVGMPIRTMCVSALTKYSLGNDKEEYCKRGMEILEKSLRLADDLGIRVVMIPGYDVYYEPSTLETKKRFLKNLKKASELAEKAGIQLGLETMENEFMNTVEKAMKYVTLCNSNYLNISGYWKSDKCSCYISVRCAGGYGTGKRKSYFITFERNTSGKIPGSAVWYRSCRF